MRVMKMGGLIVYCPGCGRRVFKTDTKFKMPLQAKCEKCNKLVLYDPESERIKLSDIPGRKTSSGKNFW